ncbi:hypothetical protein AQUCO_05400029v1 [Aquilegia coerulea]|uniref:Uncharacterized protein n=1 Tax=Aquilegia coerulea TaxID=218851 RepID=A0A2G5CHA8_AQUCA|nr:hypothetical protein AQUCO_05400029v1 [Aquilegia coerulea]
MERRRRRQEEKRKGKKLIQHNNNIDLINEVKNMQNINLQEDVEKIQEITQNGDSEKTDTQIFLVSSTPQSKSSSFTTHVSPPCAQDIELGGDMSLLGSKRKGDMLPGSSKKVKSSFPISSGKDTVLSSLNDLSRKEPSIQNVLKSKRSNIWMMKPP